MYRVRNKTAIYFRTGYVGPLATTVKKTNSSTHKKQKQITPRYLFAVETLYSTGANNITIRCTSISTQCENQSPLSLLYAEPQLLSKLQLVPYPIVLPAHQVYSSTRNEVHIFRSKNITSCFVIRRCCILLRSMNTIFCVSTYRPEYLHKRCHFPFNIRRS